MKILNISMANKALSDYLELLFEGSKHRINVLLRRAFLGDVGPGFEVVEQVVASNYYCEERFGEVVLGIS